MNYKMKHFNHFLTLSLIVTKLNYTTFAENSERGQGTIESTCGRRLVHYNALITDEFQSNEGGWPWHAAIYHFKTDGFKYKCGGTVLNSNSILTAAHCVFENNRLIIPERVTVHLGKYNLKYFGTNTQEFQVYKIVHHPNFNISDLSDDIAIIRLSTDATFNNYVQPICLSNKTEMSNVTDKFGVVIGWGASHILREVSIPVVSHTNCTSSNVFRNISFQNNFCAGYQKRMRLCDGDSGGAMTFEENGAYRIVGILSFVKSQRWWCEALDYVLFTDVAKYLDWIENAVSLPSKSENYGHGQGTIESTCGRRLVHHTALITHGFESNEGDWPWQASIYHFQTDSFKYKCGGTLINSNSVLTAAHCVFEKNRPIIPDRVLVYLGKYNLKYFGTNTQEFQAYKVIPHPNFNISDLSNDIAIIRLSTEATFNNYVQSICLWDSDKAPLSELTEKYGVVIGYGITENNEMPHILRQAYMPVVSRITCLRSNDHVFGHYLSENNFCAGFRNGTSVCNGDSGGSITFEENGVYRIRGIVSLAVAQDTGLCKTSEYVLFTDVAKYLPWIEEKTSQLIPSLSESGDCKANHFKCDTSGECIHEEKVCDGTVHCSDTSDETIGQCNTSFYCPSYGFRCGYGGCVDGFNKCDKDGDFDCVDNSDESPDLCGNSSTTLKPIANPTHDVPGSCLIPVDLPDTIKVYYEADASIEVPKGSYAEPNSSVIYRCIKKLTIEGNTTNKCFEGLWVVDHPLCRKYCSPLAISGVTINPLCEFGKEISCMQPLPPQTIVRINCARGYRKPYRTVVNLLKCEDNGEWDYHAFRCEQICGKEAPVIMSRFMEPIPYLVSRAVPWHVSIYSKIRTRQVLDQICGGTIINAKLIISAAHCFWDGEESRFHDSENFKVIAGKFYQNFNITDPVITQFRDVARIVHKPEFNDNDGLYAGDIALLILTTHLKFNMHIRPICIETDLDFNEKYVTSRLVGRVAGWELGSNRLERTDSLGRVLEYIHLQAIGNNECKRNLTLEQQRFITDDKFCADKTGSVCQVDSGSGFVYSKQVGYERVYYLRGIVSTFGNKILPQESCDNDKYSLFTNIQFHIDMITNYKSQHRPK